MNTQETLHPLVKHLIYGDIGEMPLSVLGEECPTQGDYQRLNTEQDTRLQAAATVQAWLEGRLHRGGYIHDPQRHGEGDKVPNDEVERLRPPVLHGAVSDRVSARLKRQAELLGK